MYLKKDLKKKKKKRGGGVYIASKKIVLARLILTKSSTLKTKQYFLSSVHETRQELFIAFQTSCRGSLESRVSQSLSYWANLI